MKNTNKFYKNNDKVVFEFYDDNKLQKVAISWSDKYEEPIMISLSDEKLLDITRVEVLKSLFRRIMNFYMEVKTDTFNMSEFCNMLKEEGFEEAI